MSSPYVMDQSAHYQILVLGELGGGWISYFENLKIQNELSEDGKVITILTGILTDQADLLGTLQKLYSLGLPLISVNKLEASE